MSRQSEVADAQGPSYGELKFNLATDRDTEEDYQTVRLHKVAAITPLEVPGECYLHFGDRSNPGVDLRDFVGRPIQTIGGEPFGVSYLENPTGVSGTLRLLTGLALATGAGTSDTRQVLDRVTNVTPGADTNVQSGGADLDTVAPGVGTMVIKVQLASAATFKVEEAVDGGDTVTYQFNEGTNLTAGSVYVFSLTCRGDATYNYQVDTASVEVDMLQVDYDGGLV